MTDTIFLRQTIPLSDRPVDRVIDRAILPSGVEVALIETYDEEISAYGVALRVWEPGETDPQQVALLLPTGHVAGYTGYLACLEAAPGGSIAVFYDTVTYSSDGSDEFPHMVTQPLDANGLPLGEPVVLFTWGMHAYWRDQVYFDDGSYAWLQLRETVDAAGHFVSSQFEIVRASPDGTAHPPLSVPETFDTDPELFQALSDGRLAVAWRSFSDSGPSITLQIYDPDGSSTSQTVSIGPEVEVFSDLKLLPQAEGTILVWWQSDIDFHETLKAVDIAPDGSMGPVRTLVDLDAGGGIGVYGYPRDIRFFEDGGFGVLFAQEADSWTLFYQAFAADGAATSDPVTLIDLPVSYEALKTQAWLLPAGGAVLLEQRGNFWEGITLFLRHFAPDGTPLGSAVRIAEMPANTSAYGFYLTGLADDGTLLSWTTEGPGPDGFEVTGFRTGFAPIPFRGLTEADDTEILTAPEAVDGLGGDDAITGSDGTDRILGGAGNDTLAGGDGDDFLFGGVGTNLLDGGAGEDVAHFAGASDLFDFAVSADGAQITVTGPDSSDMAAGIERFDFDDRSLTVTEMLLEGGFYNDSIAGTEAADTLTGDIGDDTLEGLEGDDLLEGGTGRDVLNGGDGNDTLIGGPEIEDGGDRIFGGEGHDSILGGAGNDLLYGMGGNDTIAGGFGADELLGQDGDDVITGSAYSDLVFGGAGNDFVNGGWGHDRINGGTGADKFYHLGIRDHGSDWVQDYNAAEGDVLLFGDPEASAGEFRLTFAHTENAEGERSGDDDVMEAFIAHVPSGFVVWALVDGAAQDHIWLRIPDTGTVDLLTLL